MLVFLTLWFATFDPCLWILASSAAVFKNLPISFLPRGPHTKTAKIFHPRSGFHVPHPEDCTQPRSLVSYSKRRMERLACSFLQVGGF